MNTPVPRQNQTLCQRQEHSSNELTLNRPQAIGHIPQIHPSLTSTIPAARSTVKQTISERRSLDQRDRPSNIISRRFIELNRFICHEQEQQVHLECERAHTQPSLNSLPTNLLHRTARRKSKGNAFIQRGDSGLGNTEDEQDTSSTASSATNSRQPSRLSFCQSTAIDCNVTCSDPSISTSEGINKNQWSHAKYTSPLNAVDSTNDKGHVDELDVGSNAIRTMSKRNKEINAQNNCLISQNSPRPDNPDIGPCRTYQESDVRENRLLAHQFCTVFDDGSYLSSPSTLSVASVSDDSMIEFVSTETLANLIMLQPDSLLIIDCRSTLDYHLSHIAQAVSVDFSRLLLRRLVKHKAEITLADLPSFHNSALSRRHHKNVLTVIYDECGKYPFNSKNATSLLHHMLKNEQIFPVVLQGGYGAFRLTHATLLESSEETYDVGCLQDVIQPTLAICDTTSSHPNGMPSRIFPFLYLGTQTNIQDADLLRSLQITHVMNASEYDRRDCVEIPAQLLHLTFAQSTSHQLLTVLPNAVEFIEKAKNSNGCAFLSCDDGTSHALAILLGYMVSTRKYTLTSARNAMQALRADIQLHPSFLNQLMAFESALQRRLNANVHSMRTADV